MNLKFSLALVLGCAWVHLGQAQDNNILWTQKFFNPTISTDVYSNVVSVHDMAQDSDKNVYVAGQYQGTIAFDKAAIEPELTSSSPDDLYFSKYDDTGKRLWVKSIACKTSRIHKIAIGKNNDIYIAGMFSGLVDFDPGEGTAIVEPRKGNYTGAAFIAQYDKDGTFKKVITLGEVSVVTDLEIDTNGNLIVTGSFSETTDFDPGSGEANLVATGTTGYSVFIAKYSDELAYINAKSLNSSYHIGLSKLELDKNNTIYLAGTYQKVADFDPSPNSFLMTSNGYTDIFLASYNMDFSFNWAKSIGAENWESLNAMEVDDDANIYMAITYKGTVDFNPDASVFNLKSIEKGQFFGKYDNTGKLLWGKSIGENTVNVVSMTLKRDALLLTGTVIGSCDFDPGDGVATLRGSAGFFMAEYDNIGNYNYVFSLGENNSVKPSCVLVEEEGIIMSGVFSGDIDFDPGDSEHILTAEQTIPAAFLVKYNTNLVLSTIITTNVSTDMVKNLTVYPNPSKNEFSFSLQENGNFDIQLFNALGKVVYEETFFGGNKTVQQHFSPGIYFIVIKSQHGKTYQGKVIFE